MRVVVLHYLCWGLYRSPDHIGLHNHETTAPSLPPPPSQIWRTPSSALGPMET